MIEPTPGSGEPIPKPEAPKGGIKVEVRQPDMMYRMITEGISKPDSFWLRINEMDFSDQMLGHAATTIRTYEKDWSINNDRPANPDVDGTYYINSLTFLSEQRKHMPDNGYFSEQKVEKLKSILENSGYKIFPTNDQEDVTFGHFYFEKNGVYLSIYTGFFNKENEKIYLQSQEKAEKDQGITDGYNTRRLADIDTASNTSIHINLVTETEVFRKKYESAKFAPVADPEDFIRTTQEYAKGYQTALNAIYETEGIIAPNETIVFRPPILNQDTVTEIKSIETPTPLRLSTEQLFPERVTFDDVVGQEEAVIELKRLVSGIRNSEVYKKRGGKIPKGVLIYGKPGTGKTLLAKAVASEAGVGFKSVDASDIGTKWYGESERLIQAVFDEANKEAERTRKVVILYFDEIDAIAPNREGAHEATKKVVSIILQNIDGIKANPNVIVLGSTNRPHDIDPALMRAGRFDKIIKADVPKTPEVRQKVLDKHLQKAKQRSAVPSEEFAPDVDLKQIADVTEGMSQADLANIINLAIDENAADEADGKSWVPIDTYKLLSVAKKVGIIKEERRGMGFILPNTKNGNGSASVVSTQQ